MMISHKTIPKIIEYHNKKPTVSSGDNETSFEERKKKPNE
jgi:hypothetical protein